jgi:hypothetical protein
VLTTHFRLVAKMCPARCGGIEPLDVHKAAVKGICGCTLAIYSRCSPDPHDILRQIKCSLVI